MTRFAKQQKQLSLAAATMVVMAIATTTTTPSLFVASASTPPPTCASLGDSWYFPNDCVFSCEDLGTTMDLERSRNVDGKLKCYCVDKEAPVCTDSPLCSDLGIVPATVQADCESVCGSDDIASSTVAVHDNGYQFHYVVSCTCGNTKQCGDDFVLFSDLDYMKSCSGKGSNSVRVESAEDCDALCQNTLVFEGGEFATNDGKKSCVCQHSGIVSINADKPPSGALVCDDATARVNDGSGLGDPCYEEVGVNQVECPYSAAAPSKPSDKQSATKTLVSSTAIVTGVWLLPW